MTPNLYIVDELQRAANTILDVDPVERRRLLVSGMSEDSSLAQWLVSVGHGDKDRPPFLNDMPTLAELAAQPGAAESLVAAGMSMLAGEIERLRRVVDRIATEEGVKSPSLAEALRDVGFEPCVRSRIVIGQGRPRERISPIRSGSD